MCRIAGFFYAPASRHEDGASLRGLREVTRFQRHGGPDEQAVVGGPGWGLAIERLAIVDVGHGRQPYRLGSVRVVFNGEIYNHSELRRDLLAKGYAFSDRCDGSILPALYIEYGAAGFAERLDGMYAIAVVDLREEPRLVLVTDELGIKPLYYQWDGPRRELHFASELPALLAFPHVNPTVSIDALDVFLSTKTPFGDQTVFDDIRVLTPGTTAVLTERGGLRMIRRSISDTVPDPVAADLAGSRRGLLSLLRAEVTQLLQGDVPVSAITSGGLDSGVVTVLAAAHNCDLATFNIAYRGRWPHDERRFAQAIAESAGTRHHQIELDPADIPGLLPTVVRHLGQPNADPITVSSYALFGAIRTAGFKVALSGDGADEIFGGYDRLREAMAVPAGADWIPSYVDALAAIPLALRESLYTPAYREYLAATGSARKRLIDQLAASTLPRLETLTQLEVSQRLPAYHLRRVDHMSMAHGVEVRPLFCQPQVVRFARSLVPRLRISGNEVKRILYHAAEGLLPSPILSRPKQPFTLPIAEMLRPGQPLFAYARDVLAPSNLRTEALIQPKALSRLFAEQSVRPSGSTALALWSMLVFELWLEQYSPSQSVAMAA